MTDEEYSQGKVLQDLMHTAAGKDLNIDMLVKGTQALQVGYNSTACETALVSHSRQLLAELIDEVILAETQSKRIKVETRGV